MNQNGVLAIIIIFVFLGVVALFTLGLKAVNNWVCTNLPPQDQNRSWCQLRPQAQRMYDTISSQFQYMDIGADWNSGFRANAKATYDERSSTTATTTTVITKSTWVWEVSDYTRGRDAVGVVILGLWSHNGSLFLSDECDLFTGLVFEVLQRWQHGAWGEWVSGIDRNANCFPSPYYLKVSLSPCFRHPCFLCA